MYDSKTVERFHKKVEQVESGCRLWTASLFRGGYGQFQANGKNMRAHRVAWELHNDMHIPEGMHVLHSCDQPDCVNPHHLSVGTHKQNMDDKKAKGRQVKGTDINGSKLTDAQVVEIRDRYSAGGVLLRELGEAYGVSRSLVGKIVNRKQWTHI